jgi:hypothetical protein
MEIVRKMKSDKVNLDSVGGRRVRTYYLALPQRARHTESYYEADAIHYQPELFLTAEARERALQRTDRLPVVYEASGEVSVLENAIGAFGCGHSIAELEFERAMGPWINAVRLTLRRKIIAATEEELRSPLYAPKMTIMIARVFYEVQISRLTSGRYSLNCVAFRALHQPPISIDETVAFIAEKLARLDPT